VAAEDHPHGQDGHPITLKTFLPADEKVGDMTVPQYLARLAAEAVTVINAADYGRAIYDLATRRALITVGEDMVNIAYDAPVDMTAEADRGRRAAAVRAGRDRPLRRRLRELQRRGEDRRRHGQRRLYARRHLSGIATGLRDLDRRMGGLQRRPDRARGPSRHGQDVARHQHRLQHRPRLRAGAAGRRLVQGHERRRRRLLLARNVVRAARHPYHLRADGNPSSKIRRGEHHESEFEKLVACSQTMQKLPLFIDQTGGISIAQLAARARRLKRQRGSTSSSSTISSSCRLLAQANENRVQEITEITTGLKALAKELGVPIIALSQLSRQVESRDDKRPQLSDLRESGSIEQDADVVLFVYREEYYLKNKEPKPGTDEYLKWEGEMNDARGKAEVIIAKQRHGPTGTVAMGFQGEFTRFFDLAEDSHLPERFE
jgi:replicative DNA helicase